MPRSREQIMTEWDAIRATIAAGCDHSGPRDWLEGVLDEQDKIIADLVRRLAAQPTFTLPVATPPPIRNDGPGRRPLCGCIIGAVCGNSACPYLPSVTSIATTA